MLENVDSSAEVVVDARGSARFRGTAPEPRKGVRGGHIPGSVNVPFDTLLQDGRYCFHRSTAPERTHYTIQVTSFYGYVLLYQHPQLLRHTRTEFAPS